jgi:hypothetical protein
MTQTNLSTLQSKISLGLHNVKTRTTRGTKGNFYLKCAEFFGHSVFEILISSSYDPKKHDKNSHSANGVKTLTHFLQIANTTNRNKTADPKHFFCLVARWL